MKLARRDKWLRVRLNHQTIGDLPFWKRLSVSKAWRPIYPGTVGAVVHTDAPEVGYGSTLNFDDFNAVVQGLCCHQSVWEWRNRSKRITYRELNALRIALARSLVTPLRARSDGTVLTHI